MSNLSIKLRSNIFCFESCSVRDNVLNQQYHSKKEKSFLGMSHGIHSCQGELILGFTEVIRESCVKQCFTVLSCKYKLQTAVAKMKMLLFSMSAMISGKENHMILF